MKSATPERRDLSRVLIVETNEERVKEYYGMLNGVQRFRVGAVSGKLATFERLKKWKPQIILIGDNLDGHCGLDLTIWIRKYSNLPIVVITEDDSFDYFLKILNSGADGCVYHPVPAPLLISQLLALLRRSYRYSVLQEIDLPKDGPRIKDRSSFRPPPETAQSIGAPTTNLAAPTASGNSQAICGVCNYSGAAGRFHSVTADGQTVMRCPTCGSAHQIRSVAGVA